MAQNIPGQNPDVQGEDTALSRLKQRLVDQGEDMVSIEGFESRIRNFGVGYTQQQRMVTRSILVEDCAMLKTEEGRRYIMWLFDSAPLTSIKRGQPDAYYKQVFDVVLFAGPVLFDPDTIQMAKTLTEHVQDAVLKARMLFELQQREATSLISTYAMAQDNYIAESCWERAQQLLSVLPPDYSGAVEDSIKRAQDYRRSRGMKTMEGT